MKDYQSPTIQFIFKISCVFLCCGIFSSLCFADETKIEISNLVSLIDYCLTHSTDSSISESEVNYQQTVSQVVDIQRWMPQIDIYTGVQSYRYDHKVYQANNLKSNNGINPVFGASVSFDLSKLIGTELDVAKEHERNSRIKEVISKRNIVRSVKKNFYLYETVKDDISSFESTLKYYDRLGTILKRQAALGINNEIETQQYKIQRGFLEADLGNKKIELDTIFSTFTSLMSLPRERVKEIIENLPRPNLPLDISESKLDELKKRNDDEMISSLTADFALAKVESESFKTYPLPAVYLRTIKQNPSMPSANGPNQMAEIGLSLDVTAFFTKKEQKRELDDNLKKSDSLKQKNILEYRNSVLLTIDEIKHNIQQEKILSSLKHNLDKTLQLSIGYYSQKRMDTLSILDLVQKSLNVSLRSRIITLRIQSLDAELEYLLGAH